MTIGKFTTDSSLRVVDAKWLDKTAQLLLKAAHSAAYRGRKIDAVQYYRQATETSEREATSYIEAYCAKYNGMTVDVPHMESRVDKIERHLAIIATALASKLTLAI